MQFIFPLNKASIHVGNYYYMAGGSIDGKSLKTMRKINSKGMSEELP